MAKKRQVLLSFETGSTASDVTASSTMDIPQAFYGWTLKTLMYDMATAGTVYVQLGIQSPSFGPASPNGYILKRGWLRCHTTNTTTSATMGTSLIWDGALPLIGNGGSPETFTVFATVMNVCGTTIPHAIRAWLEEPDKVAE